MASFVAGSVWRDWVPRNLLHNAVSLGADVFRPRELHHVCVGNAELQAHVLPRLVSQHNGGKETRLHHAAKKDWRERAAALLAAGADPAARDWDKLTPVHASALALRGKGRVGALLARDATAYPVSLLEEDCGRDRPLVQAAFRRRPELVQALLARGVDPNLPGRNGTYALHGAAGTGDIHLMQALLAAGANVNARLPYGGGIPLHMAASGGHLEAVRLLLKAGAQVNAPGDFQLGTPLTAAAQSGHPEVVRALLEAGADPKSESGCVPALHVAAEEGHVSVITALLDAGVGVDTRDSAGRTAFYHACGKGRLQVAQLLHARGADLHVKIGYPQRSACDEARSEGKTAVVKWLQQLMRSK